MIGLLCILIILIISISVLYYSKTKEGFADSAALTTTKTLSLLNLQDKIRDFIGYKEVQPDDEYDSPSMIQDKLYQHADYSY